MRSKPVVLIVDDNELLRFACRLLLQQAGFAVVEAQNGLQGIEKARLHLPDLVLLDLAMPVLDGWQTIAVLSRDARTAGIPVVAFTAEEAPDLLERLRRAGFRGYAEKTVSRERLITFVRGCIAADRDGEEWSAAPAERTLHLPPHPGDPLVGRASAG